MKKIDAHLADYAHYHQTSGNVACHFVGIPLIVFGLLAMLRAVPLTTVGGFTVTAAEVVVLLSAIYYLTLDVALGGAMVVLSCIFDAGAVVVANAWIGLAAFVIGWIFQGIGHAKYEKKSPAFLKNFVHLLVGPVFLINEATKLRPIEHPRAL